MRDISFLKKNLIAHRGLHNIKDNIYENSIEAFKNSIKNNYIIELDVHILKDGNIVVFHDDNLKRIFDIDKNIKDYTYSELSNIKAGKYYIPLFSEVLKVVDGSVPLLIELKTDVRGNSLVDGTMELLKDYKGEYAIQSFSPMMIAHLRKKYPDVIRGQLACKTWSKKANFFVKYSLSKMYLNFYAKPDFLSLSVKDYSNKEFLKYKKKHPVFGWVVRDKNKKEELSKILDNCICEMFIYK